MKSTLFEQPQYKKVISDMKDLENKLSKMEQEKIYDAVYLMQLKNDGQQALKADLQQFYSDRSQEIESDMQQIEDKYKPNYDKIDTQKELLKRQDWERKLKLSSDDDLKERVNEFRANGQGEQVQLEMLQLELKQRGLNAELSTLTVYMREHGVNEPHLKDNVYKTLQEELNLIANLKWAKLLYIDNGSGDYEAYSPKYFQ